MDWTGLGLRNNVVRWLEAAAGGRYAQDRRIDPFATSMRDFDDASAHLKAIRSGVPLSLVDVRQRITDLKNAGLVVAGGGALTELGEAVIQAWERYGVDTAQKADEFPRHLLFVLEARRVGDPVVNAFLQYWSDLRTHFDAFELIDSWDALYSLNYLDVERDGFNPGATYRAEQTAVADIEFDLADYARDTAATAVAIKGGERIEGAIGGKLPRGRHRATFCMSLEVVLSDGLAADHVLQTFGYPKKPRIWEPFDEALKSNVAAIVADYSLVAEAEEEQPQPPSSPSDADEALPSLPKSSLSLPGNIDFSSVLVDAPKPDSNAQTSTQTSSSKKTDYKQKAEANDTAGRLGEEFALGYERWRLRDHPELLEKIRHVSAEDDTLGYDIESFELDGTPRFVEVKGTLGPIETRFFLSANELRCAEAKGQSYVILRAARLADNPECCEVRCPFDGKIVLKPETYSVVFAPA